MRKIHGFLSVLLAVVLMLSNINTTVFAAEANELGAAESTSVTESVINEVGETGSDLAEVPEQVQAESPAAGREEIPQGSSENNVSEETPDQGNEIDIPDNSPSGDVDPGTSITDDSSSLNDEDVLDPDVPGADQNSQEESDDQIADGSGQTDINTEGSADSAEQTGSDEDTENEDHSDEVPSDETDSSAPSQDGQEPAEDIPSVIDTILNGSDDPEETESEDEATGNEEDGKEDSEENSEEDSEEVIVEISKPAMILEGSVSDIKVTVDVPEDALPEGTELTVAKALISDTQIEGFEKILESELEEVWAVSLTFSKDKELVYPEKEVIVTIEVPGMSAYKDNLKSLFAIDTQGQIAMLHPGSPDQLSISGDTAVTTVSDFVNYPTYAFVTVKAPEEDADEDEKTEEETEEEAAEEEQKELNEMPAAFFTGRADGVTVMVTAGEGVFPAGTYMIVTPVSSEEVWDIVDNTVDGEVQNVKAVDISFYNVADEPIQPEGPVQVVLNSSLISTGNANEEQSPIPNSEYDNIIFCFELN